MLQRPRRLRSSAAIRHLVAETQLYPSDFIAPIFVMNGQNTKEEIASMPDYYRFSLDQLIPEIKKLYELGCRAVLVFAKVEDSLKDNKGKEAINANGLMQRAIREIKEALPEIFVMSDVAMDPYSQFGHDGIVRDGEIINDESTELLAEIALSHAQAGVDMVAPSDMMDGRIEVIRKKLDENNYSQCGIMSYSAKYASCFYGPFRDALDSAPVNMKNVPKDKKSYQMDPANITEALKEAQLDIDEGADILMIKPALAYLDVISRIKEISPLPLAAYHVSGEYAMIKAASAKGWIDEKAAMLEVLTSIKRSGADLIATYFIYDILNYLKKN